MTDLVFLLMIFFIILSTLAQPQYTVNLPSSNSISEPVDKTSISVAIGSDSKFYMDEELNTPLSLEQIKTQILAERQKYLDEGKEEINLRVSADIESQFNAFSEMMTFAKQNKLKVVIVTQN